MSKSKLLNEELILMNMKEDTREAVLARLAGLLIDKGYARESFAEAVIRREQSFPTGLATEIFGVAMPHTDPEHIIKPGISFGLLENPVEFRLMENPQAAVKVKLVFMLAIKSPEEQIKMLQSLVSLFRDKDLLLKIGNSGSAAEICRLTGNLLA